MSKNDTKKIKYLTAIGKVKQHLAQLRTWSGGFYADVLYKKFPHDKKAVEQTIKDGVEDGDLRPDYRIHNSNDIDMTRDYKKKSDIPFGQEVDYPPTGDQFYFGKYESYETIYFFTDYQKRIEKYLKQLPPQQTNFTKQDVYDHFSDPAFKKHYIDVVLDRLVHEDKLSVSYTVYNPEDFSESVTYHSRRAIPFGRNAYDADTGDTFYVDPDDDIHATYTLKRGK